MIDARIRSLVALHASLILGARAAEIAAARWAKAEEVDRKEMAEDEAAEMRTQASTLAWCLEAHDVHVPDPAQLSLFSDGGGR